jgi:hypothetical protein
MALIDPDQLKAELDVVEGVLSRTLDEQRKGAVK